MEKTIEIPEGYKAIIDGNKIILELKESEDERIRKEIISYIKSSGAVTNPNWIAWLEKQGSQNLANSAKSCKDEQKPTLPGFEEQEGVAGRDYIPVEWVEAIENYGKWKIVRVNEQNPAWSEEDEIGFRDAMWAIEQARTIAKNENDMGNLWYAENWLKSLKERVQLRQEWSEKDEYILEIITSALQVNFEPNERFSGYEEYMNIDLINWLKSLKERYTWKPSEEQLETLNEVIKEAIKMGGRLSKYSKKLESLESLYNDLKALSEK